MAEPSSPKYLFLTYRYKFMAVRIQVMPEKMAIF